MLSDFSFSLEKGRVYGLLGKNGVCKSTLLFLMCGLLTPKHGRVMYHGVDMRRRLPETLRDVFLVPEEFDLPAVSLVQFVELNSPFYPNFSKEDMMTYLHLFEMDWNIHLGGLSMGQKKKVFMSFALATHTSLLLMDEPTSALDPISTSMVEELALELKDRYTIVIVTHNMQQAARISDKTAVFLLGELLEMGDTERLFSTPGDKRTEDYISGRFG